MVRNTKKIYKRGTFDISITLATVIITSFLLLTAFTVFFQNKPQNSNCANSISCIPDLSGKKEAANEGIFMGKKVLAPNLPENNAKYALSELNNVLGDQTGDYKHIYVDLTTQRLFAYEGTRQVFTFPVSTGKWHPTPTGDFRIWIWLKYTRMKGGDPAKGTYYDLPNVPFTMYFYNSETPKTWGFSLHGAYWHNNFGHPMSHGCVNLPIDAAGQIYYWTNPLAGNIAYPAKDTQGTLITIYGTTPANETSFVD